MSFAAMMVHLDVERDCEQRVQLALALADRFQAALIGIAGLALRPAFAAGGVVVYREPTEHDCRAVTARFEEMGKKFLHPGTAPQADRMAHRSRIALRARGAGGEGSGSRHRRTQAHEGATCTTLSTPASSCCGRDGRSWWCPISSLHHRFAASWWHARTRANAGARCATRFRFCGKPRKFWWSRSARTDSKSQDKKSLADVARYLVRHGVIVADEIWKRARGPAATELLELVRAEKADLIVAGGYGHSRLGEWIFGGVTHELLASSPVCCMLSH